MTPSTRFAALAAGLVLAACQQTPSANIQPPIAGTAVGPGAPAIQQLSREQPHSGSVSAGTPTITGSTGTAGGDRPGRPSVTYSGPGSGTLSTGTPQQIPPFRSSP